MATAVPASLPVKLKNGLAAPQTSRRHHEQPVPIIFIACGSGASHMGNWREIAPRFGGTIAAPIAKAVLQALLSGVMRNG